MFDVSICMPYFERLELLRNTLQSFRRCGYFHSDLKVEISIVDDGSIREPVPKHMTEPEYMTVSYLPQKTEWKNPCVPLNKAVRQSSAPFILLQSPETYHEKPLLFLMMKQIESYKDVSMAQVKGAGQTQLKWYVHPKIRPVKYWFCQMMTRQFFDELNGFDEDFREGQGWDDNEFAKRIEQNGGIWKWCDESATAVHVRKRVAKPKMNRQLFKKKFG